MSNQYQLQELSVTFGYFVNNCNPDTVTAPGVMGLISKARNYLAAIDGRKNEADVVKTRVRFRNAAETLLKRTDWIGASAQQSLRDFINEQPEFLSEGAYKFTYDFFSANIEQWQKNLGRFAGLPNLAFLEVGSFEGKSACWVLQNILTHETSNLTCIDVFFEEKHEGVYDTTGLDSALMSREDRFEHNIRQTNARHRVEKIVGLSQKVLRTLPLSFYDFIYIDGSHIARGVLEDAVLAWQLLKQGGIITFDDYLWQDHPDPLLCPRMAIDGFLSVYEGHYQLVHKAYQVTLEKLS